MKKLLFIFLTILAFNAMSQDIIITQERDTIECKINALMDGNVYYSVQESDGMLNHHSIAEVDIIGYKKAGAATFSKTKIVDKEAKKLSSMVGKDHRFRIGGSYGRVIRITPLSSVTPGWEEFYKGLMRGYGFGIDLAYFFNERNGISVNYVNSSFRQTTQAYMADSSGAVIHGPGEYVEKVNITTITPSYAFRMISASKKNIGIFRFGFGYTKWDHTTTLDDFFFKAEGETIGMLIGAEYNYLIDDKFAIGASINYETGTVFTFTFDDGERVWTESYTEGEGLAKFDLTLNGVVYF